MTGVVVSALQCGIGTSFQRVAGSGSGLRSARVWLPPRPAPLTPALSLTCLSVEVLHPFASWAEGSVASRGV